MSVGQQGAAREVGEVGARRLLDCVEDTILVADEHLRVLWNNQAFLRHFLTDGTTTSGLDLTSYIHHDDLDSAMAGLARLLDDGHAIVPIRVRRGSAGTARFEWHPVEVIGTNMLDDAEVGGLVLCFRDLTREESFRTALERELSLASKNADLRRELDERQSLLTRLVRLQTMIQTSGPLSGVCDAICDAVVELLGVDLISLRLVDTDGQLDLFAARGFEVADNRSDRRKSALAGIGGAAFTTGTEQLTYDNAPVNATAVLALPIRDAGNVVGSLTVGSRLPDRRFSESERDVLRLLADHAGDALATSRAEELINRALTDELTGLPQRRAALDTLQLLLDEHQAASEPLTLLFIDLDGFKAVNDSRGHDYGDRVLRQVADRLRGATRDVDWCARLGGDEFMVICPNTTLDQARNVASNIAEAIAQPFVLGHIPFVITASIGVAGVSAGVEASTTAERLIRSADIAMYRGKTTGRNRVVTFDQRMEADVVARVEREHELRNAIANDGLEIAFQPVIKLSNGETIGFEALARWTTPSGIRVPPTEFVALANSLGMGRAFDLKIAAMACEKLAASNAGGLLSINVSPPNLEDPSFAAELIDIASETVGPDRLMVEVLESSELSASAAMTTLTTLRSHDVRIAIDDFGTGYSSLSYLDVLPIDVIKLDRQFVSMLGGPASGRVAEALLQMASALTVDVIAEGVETAEQRDHLSSLGTPFAQGFLFGAPNTLVS